MNKENSISFSFNNRYYLLEISKNRIERLYFLDGEPINEIMDVYFYLQFAGDNIKEYLLIGMENIISRLKRDLTKTQFLEAQQIIFSLL